MCGSWRRVTVLMAAQSLLTEKIARLQRERGVGDARDPGGAEHLRALTRELEAVDDQLASLLSDPHTVPLVGNGHQPTGTRI